MIDSRRRLPHWVPDAVPVFVTFRLAGSLPRHVCASREQVSAGERFVAVDPELDRVASGPFWLKDSGVAGIQKTIRYVEANPVKAGLVRSVEEWPWSSAYLKEAADPG